LFTVFFLCGLWHGAGWTFIAWGMYHGLLLVIERVLRLRWGFVPSGPAGQAATLLLVVLGWVLFRAPSLPKALQFYAALFGGGASGELTFPFLYYLTSDRMVYFAAGAVIALLPLKRAAERLEELSAAPALTVVALLSFFYSIVLAAANGFNPFIYFRF
jgi:alginate O-acetyltransferase complex protein AlgI